MKVLLDENLPLDLRHFLAEHEAITVAYMGWKGLRNGELMARAASEGLDVLVTRDAGFQRQQNLSTLPIAVIVLPGHAGKLDDLRPLVPALLKAVNSIRPRTMIRLA